MSLDLHIYAPVSVDQEVLQGSVAELADVRIVGGSPAELRSFVIERQLRGRFESLATMDGPFDVEPEDLPGVVAANALGVGVVYYIAVEGSSQAGFKIARRIARLVASSCSGVVFDPQLDVIVWPRGGQRGFEPPKEATLDVVNFSWYIRRADALADIASLFLDQVIQLFPEATPAGSAATSPSSTSLRQSASRDLSRVGVVRVQSCSGREQRDRASEAALRGLAKILVGD